MTAIRIIGAVFAAEHSTATFRALKNINVTKCDKNLNNGRCYFGSWSIGCNCWERRATWVVFTIRATVFTYGEEIMYMHINSRNIKFKPRPPFAQQSGLIAPLRQQYGPVKLKIKRNAYNIINSGIYRFHQMGTEKLDR